MPPYTNRVFPFSITSVTPVFLKVGSFSMPLSLPVLHDWVTIPVIVLVCPNFYSISHFFNVLLICLSSFAISHSGRLIITAHINPINPSITYLLLYSSISYSISFSISRTISSECSCSNSSSE